MKRYRIAFIGMGSIGQRHLRNVHAYCAQRRIALTTDLYRSTPAELPQAIRALAGSQRLLSDGPDRRVRYDAVFIANPTALHYRTLLQFKDSADTFFIEKPVFDTTGIPWGDDPALAGKRCYVACPLRYHPVLRYAKQLVETEPVHAARAISSSYLPDWRPGQDYRRCYSARRELGGGVAIDLIHEWDYLTWLFGTPCTSLSLQGKVSGLEIDCEDIALYIARTPETVIELHLDYFGRHPLRRLELFTAEDTILCDILGGCVRRMQSGGHLRFDSDRNGFQMGEIVHFFDIMEGRTPNDSTVAHAIEVLKLAKGEKL